MWSYIKNNICGMLILVGLLLVVCETVKFQYNVSVREAHKNVKISIMAKALQTYNLKPEVVHSLGHQIEELTHDSDSYRYHLGN